MVYSMIKQDIGNCTRFVRTFHVNDFKLRLEGLSLKQIETTFSTEVLRAFLLKHEAEIADS